MWVSRKKRGLRNWVLIILRRGPRTGAQMMDEMEVMTRGWWRPSPGSVYPLLEELVREGAVRRLEDGRYELKPQMDRAPWEWMPSPRTPKEVVSELQGLAAYLEDLSRSDPRCCADIAPDLVAVSGRLQKLAA